LISRVASVNFLGVAAGDATSDDVIVWTRAKGRIQSATDCHQCANQHNRDVLVGQKQLIG